MSRFLLCLFCSSSIAMKTTKTTSGKRTYDFCFPRSNPHGETKAVAKWIWKSISDFGCPPPFTTTTCTVLHCIEMYHIANACISPISENLCIKNKKLDSKIQKVICLKALKAVLTNVARYLRCILVKTQLQYFIARKQRATSFCAKQRRL